MLWVAFRHPEARSYRRRSSAIDFPSSTARRASLAFRKNEQISFDNNNRRMSLLDSKPNGEINKSLKNLTVTVSFLNYLIFFKVFYTLV